MRLALLPLLITSLPAVAEPAALHSLPMTMQASHPTVRGTLDGRDESLNLVVDSAASATLLDAAVVQRFKLQDPNARNHDAQGASAGGLALRSTRGVAMALGSLRLQMTALQADLASLSPAGGAPLHGIIGQDITARFDTRWDFANARLMLWPAQTLPATAAYCQDNALPDRSGILKGFGFVTLQLGDEGVEAIGVVDTGAAQTILNDAAARALGLRTDGSDARVRARSKGSEGLGGKPTPTWLYTLPVLASAGWQHPAVEVRISELPVFRSIGLDQRPAVILGADVMQGGQVDISAGAERICLQR
ncbi:pepsin/retropepsin-like aspartic protease family protein [uncultured Stenotrophomonas sp.]|uniref:pepsin/retropepsin-like aspartic protease family protein n=1 Tax=uncultured Stenotrophomonas sp. TaxID=165438 RepID=UPI0025FA665B|nr:pepsin/retropepsin-like aspartic protease family protein [uncultured Stenotrophomonas sp.]